MAVSLFIRLIIIIGVSVGGLFLYSPDTLDDITESAKQSFSNIFNSTITNIGNKTDSVIDNVGNIIDENSDIEIINDTTFLNMGKIQEIIETDCTSDNECNVEIPNCDDICICSLEDGSCLKEIF